MKSLSNMRTVSFLLETYNRSAISKANGPRTQIKTAKLIGSNVRNLLRVSPRFHSFNPGIQAVSPVKNELEQQAAPRRVILQIVVKFRGHCTQLRKVVPRDRGQIMVLIVVTH